MRSIVLILMVLALGSAAAHAQTPAATPAGFEAAARAFAANNLPEARRLAALAAAKGDAQAQTMMGYMLSQGMGGARDDAAAARWYGAAARLGEPDAYFGLGMMATDNRGGLSLQHAAGYLRQAADKNHAEAARRLAELYYIGKGVKKDPRQVAYWLEKSAALNDPASAYAAGIMYAEGDQGVPRDVVKARKYLLQAANAGLPDAMSDYGLYLYQGRTGAMDKAGAAQWFAKAAAKGDPTGQFLYAYVLSRGEGVTRNLDEAYGWLVRADVHNDAEDAADRATLRRILEAALTPDQRSRIEARVRTTP